MKKISCLFLLVVICLSGARSASLQVRTLEQPLILDPSNRDLSYLVQGIQEIIRNTIKHIQEIIAKAADELKNTLITAGENIIAISTNARKEVENAIAEMKNKIQADLDIAKKCINEHKADIDNVSKILDTNLQVCTKDYESKIQAAEQKVQAEIDKLLKLVATAEDIIPKCISENGLINGVVCILKKSKELSSELTSQIAEVQNVLANSLADIKKAITDGRNCGKLAVDIARLEIQNVLEKINLCINESAQNGEENSPLIRM